MIEILSEVDVCIQSDLTFAYYIVRVDGRNVFSTEDERYILTSPALFREDDVTLTLVCDRNSAEAPELGPKLDLDLAGPLYIRRYGQTVQFQTGRQEDRITHFEAPLEDWLAAVAKFADHN